MLKKLTAKILIAVFSLPALIGVVSPITNTVYASPNLEITNTVNKDPVDRGDVLTYTITVKNSGDKDLTTTKLWINEPNLADYVDGSTNYQGFPGGDLKTLTDAWIDDGVNFGTLPAGKWIVLKYQTKVADNANNGDLIWSVASAKSDQTARVQANASSLVFLENPSICASKTSNKSVVQPGEVVTYTIEICNNGNMVLNNVRVFDALPSTVTYVNGSTSYTRGDFSTDVTDAWIKDGVNLGDISDENKGILKFKVKVKDNVKNGTVIRNAARVKSDQTPVWIECDNTIKVKFGKEPKVLSEVKQLPDTGPGLILLLVAATVPAGVFIRKLKTKI